MTDVPIADLVAHIKTEHFDGMPTPQGLIAEHVPPDRQPEFWRWAIIRWAEANGYDPDA